MKKLRFSGFPPKLRDEASLRTVFGTFGSVVSLHLADIDNAEQVSGTCKFAEAEDASQTFAALNGLKIGDYTIKVEREEADADDSKRREEKRRKKEEKRKREEQLDEGSKKAAPATALDSGVNKSGTKVAEIEKKPKVSTEAKPKLVEGGKKRESEKLVEEVKKKLKAAEGASSKHDLVTAEKKTTKLDSSSGDKKGVVPIELKRQTSTASEKERKKSSLAFDGKKANLETEKPRQTIPEMKRQSSASEVGKSVATKKKELGDENKAVRSITPPVPAKPAAGSKDAAAKEKRVAEEESREKEKKKKVPSDSTGNAKEKVDVASVSAEKQKDDTKIKDTEHSRGVLAASSTSKKTEPAETLALSKSSKSVGGERTGMEKPEVKPEISREALRKTEVISTVTSGLKPQATDESALLDSKSTSTETMPLRPSSADPVLADKAKQKELAIAAAKSAVAQSAKQIHPITRGDSTGSVPEKLDEKSAKLSIPVSSDGKDDDVWEEYLDERYGEYYYFNPATNETTWERPRAGTKIVKMLADSVTNETAESSSANTTGSDPTKNFVRDQNSTESEEKTMEETKKPLPATEEVHSDISGSNAASSAEDAPRPVPVQQITVTPPSDDIKLASPSNSNPAAPTGRRGSVSSTFERSGSVSGNSSTAIAPSDLERRQGETISGVITHIKPNFGFIRCHATPTFYMREDMFFHFDELATGYHPKLGDEVEFEIGFNLTRRQPKATSVRRMGMKSANSSQVSSPTSAPTGNSALQTGAASESITAMNLPSNTNVGSASYPASSTVAFRGQQPLPAPGASSFGKREQPAREALPTSGPPRRHGRSHDRAPSREGSSRLARRRSRSPPSQGLRRQFSSPAAPSTGTYGRFANREPTQRRKDGEWNMYIDRATNKPYWHCPATNETTWTNPHRQ